MRSLLLVACSLALLGGCHSITVDVAPAGPVTADGGELDQLVQLARDAQGFWVGTMGGNAAMVLTLEFVTEPGARRGTYEFKCAVPDGGNCGPFADLFADLSMGKFLFAEMTDTGATVVLRPKAGFPGGLEPPDLTAFVVGESQGVAVLGFSLPSPDDQPVSFAFRRVGGRDAGVPDSTPDAGH